MMITPVPAQRFGGLVVSLALVANLIAAGVPLLHALAHEHGHGEVQGHVHDLDAHAPSVGHEHGEIHPASLHDDFVVIPRRTVDLGYALPAAPNHGPVAVEAEIAPPRVAALFVFSRAPPDTPPARAPPHV